MVFQDMSTIKAGKLRPLSNDPILPQLNQLHIFYSVLRFSLFPRLVILTFSTTVSIRLLLGCGSSCKRTCAGRTLANCSPVLAGFFLFFVFSFSLPVIAQTQEMKQARKEIRQLIPASACR